MFSTKRSLASTLKTGLLLMVASFTLSWANTPPPPVNQNLGIPDSVFNNLDKLNCAYCHKADSLTDAERAQIGWTFTPPTVKDGVLADRHHAKVGLIMGEHTQAPFGTAGEAYECLSCHKLEWDDATSMYQLSDNFKNCLNCHTQIEGSASVHHLTAQAQSLNCKHCHGSLIDNPNDGHYIPTGRTPTMVTPRTSQGKGPNGEGACTFCHNAGTDDISGIAVKENSTTHHSTGIGQVGISDLDCTLCHDQAGSDWAVRRCENCHGINSIHNIQADSNGDGKIVAGGETAYYGHIGNSPVDCDGCHGGYKQSATGMAPGSGPIVPTLSDLSTFRAVAGQAVTVTVTGKALTNDVATPTGMTTLKSVVTLTDSNGKVTELTPETISESSLTVTIPADLAPGSYYLRAKKAANESNPMSFVIVPKATISNVSLSDNIITVSGSGFSAYMAGSDSGVGISVGGTECSVDSWTDTQIVAKCSANCGSVVVEGVFGSASKDVPCGDDEPVYTYDMGWDAGYNPGFEEGKEDSCNNKPYQIDSHFDNDGEYDDGWKAGYTFGYDKGWKSCKDDEPVYTYDEGWDAGYDPGFEEGKNDALNGNPYQIDSHFDNDGEYDDGWKDGYTFGYDKGWKSIKG